MYINRNNDFFGDYGYIYGNPKYDTKSNKEISTIWLALILVFSVVISIGVGFTAYDVLAPYYKDPDVIATASVSGDDVIVNLYESPMYSEVAEIGISIEGYDIPEALAIETLTGSKVIYEDLASGIIGSHDVTLTAIFPDGSSKIIWEDLLRFT